MAKTLHGKIEKFKIEKIGIGDGKGGYDTEKIISEIIEYKPETEFCRIREAGASVYSASEVAAADLPGRSPAECGAITLARRLINPIGEFVKVSLNESSVMSYRL